MQKIIERIFSLIVIVAAVFFYHESNLVRVSPWQQTSSGFYPKLVSVFLIILGGFYLMSTFKGTGTEEKEVKEEKIMEGEETGNSSGKQYHLVVTVIILFFIYILALNIFGYVLSTIIFMTAFMWLINLKKIGNLPLILLISIGTTAVVYIVFQKLLTIFLPGGTLFS